MLITTALLTLSRSPTTLHGMYNDLYGTFLFWLCFRLHAPFRGPKASCPLQPQPRPSLPSRSLSTFLSMVSEHVYILVDKAPVEASRMRNRHELGVGGISDSLLVARGPMPQIGLPGVNWV